MGLVKEFFIQLYSIKDETQKDFVGSIKKLSSLGYNGVEFAYDNGGLSAKEMKDLLNGCGMSSIGAHVGGNELKDNLDKIIEFHAEIGTKYIICPGFGSETKDGWLKFAEASNKIGERVKAAGMLFGYHNHAHEFTQSHDGETVFDIYFGNTDADLVKAEIDFYWTAHAGVPALPLIEKYGKRLDLVHVKQMKDFESKQCTDLDSGFVDYKTITEAVVKHGVVKGFVLEQEEFPNRPIWDALLANREYINSL